MARITAKELYCDKANKTETVFPGTNPEVQSPFVLQAKGRKAMSNNNSKARVAVFEVMCGVRNCAAGNKEKSKRLAKIRYQIMLRCRISAFQKAISCYCIVFIHRSYDKIKAVFFCIPLRKMQSKSSRAALLKLFCYKKAWICALYFRPAFR